MYHKKAADEKCAKFNCADIIDFAHAHNGQGKCTNNINLAKYNFAIKKVKANPLKVALISLAMMSSSSSSSAESLTAAAEALNADKAKTKSPSAAPLLSEPEPSPHNPHFGPLVPDPVTR